MSDKTPIQIEQKITDILEDHFWLPSIEAKKVTKDFMTIMMEQNKVNY